MIYLITKMMSKGKQIGFASILGLGTGVLIHTFYDFRNNYGFN
jgi:threonine/homoserine/homoserine lactone efflux protein